MDSRVVTREIRREIWPALRNEGFQSCTSRTAWRQTAARTWVVNFQSFNAYFSSVDGCTTFSFAINLGIYLPSLESEPQPLSIKPTDYQCQLRRKLWKGIEQTGYLRKDVWYVEPLGENILDVLADARSAILRDGMSWFRRFESDDEVLRTLIEEDGSEELFGIGARWSPRRKLLIGRLAVSIGQEELGIRLLNEGEAEMQTARLEIESLGRNRRRPGPEQR